MGACANPLSASSRSVPEFAHEPVGDAIEPNARPSHVLDRHLQPSVYYIVCLRCSITLLPTENEQAEQAMNDTRAGPPNGPGRPDDRFEGRGVGPLTRPVI